MNANSDALPYHYYVYYRIRQDVNHDDFSAALKEMQILLGKKTGIAGRLLRRASDDRTWMEIYKNVSDIAIFETELHREAEKAGVMGYIEPGSARHVERFIECA